MGDFTVLAALVAVLLPQAAPAAAPLSGEAPLTVTFSPNSSAGSLYQWDFDFNPDAGLLPDYSSEIGEEILYTYPKPGAYTARLRIYDAVTGVPSDADFAITVLSPPSSPEVLVAAASPLVLPGEAVSFTAAATASPGRAISSYSWDFDGDGFADAVSPGGPSAAVTHAFSSQGPALVAVTASDDVGLTATACAVVKVSAPPVVSFPDRVVRLSAPGYPLPLAASALTGAPWAIDSFQWDFGDGTIVTLPGGPSSSVTHAYAAVGNYVVTVAVTNTAGQSNDNSLDVQVVTAPAIKVSQTAVVSAPSTVKDLRATSVTAVFLAMAVPLPGDSVTGFGWDFDGDGIDDETSPGGYSASVTHTWPDATAAAIAVKAYLGSGQPPLTAAAEVKVSSNIPKVPSSSLKIALAASADGAPPASTVNIRVGHVVAFSADVSAVSAKTQLGKVLWDFDGDGLRDREDGIEGFTSAGARLTASYQYRSAGTFTARAMVVQNEVATGEATVMIQVSPGTAPLECFISQPRPGGRVWGNHVSLHARTAPAILTRRVEFRYRPDDGLDKPWKVIGTATPPPYTSLSVPWDVTRLAPGPYELLAVATDTSNDVAFSSALQPVTVTVDPDAPDEEENLEGILVRAHTIDPNVATRTEIAQDTAVEFPPHAFGMEYTTIRLERPFSNPHLLEARLQGLQFVPGSFRRLVLNGGAGLQQSSKIALYDLNPGGALDGLGADPKRLGVYQFDNLRSRWVPLPGQVVQPAEDLARATLMSMGDVGLAVEPQPRAPSGSSSGGCGLLGPELLLAALVLARLRSRVS